MGILKKTFSIVFLIFAVTLFSIEVSQVYENLIKKYEKINLYQADFNQINYWSEIGDTLISNGKIYYNKEKLLMNYLLPKKQKMLLDSSKIVIWDIADKTAIITENTSSISRPIDIIKEFWDNSEIDVNQNKKSMKITLKNDEQTIRVELNDYLIKNLTITDLNGNYVKYTFKNAKINKKIGKSIFEINLPKDTNIINNTNSEE